MILHENECVYAKLSPLFINLLTEVEQLKKQLEKTENTIHKEQKKQLEMSVKNEQLKTEVEQFKKATRKF